MVSFVMQFHLNKRKEGRKGKDRRRKEEQKKRNVLRERVREWRKGGREGQEAEKVGEGKRREGREEGRKARPAQQLMNAAGEKEATSGS